jgi:DNA-binding transcriptional ArsR family regulator
VNEKFQIALTAALISDPARAAMLTAMLDGRAFPAGELACAANVSAQSASMHLAQLLQGGLVRVTPQGRHRYYSIASPAVAHAVEALGAISTVRTQKPAGEAGTLCYARTCYDHLAGEIAVKLVEAFEKQRLLVPKGARDYELTRKGESFFANWEIDIAALRIQRRSFARRCLDWTERRDHLAGALGSAIRQKFLDAKWIVHDGGSRAVHLTVRGRRDLEPLLSA